MITSEARVATAVAARYLSQLCKHFEHKLPVSYDQAQGRIEFAAGVLALKAEDNLLTLRAEAADEARLAQLEGVVVRHLERFAFRDKPEIRWQRAVSA